MTTNSTIESLRTIMAGGMVQMRVVWVLTFCIFVSYTAVLEVPPLSTTYMIDHILLQNTLHRCSRGPTPFNHLHDRPHPPPKHSIFLDAIPAKQMMETACSFNKTSVPNYKPTQYQNQIFYGRITIIEGYN